MKKKLRYLFILLTALSFEQANAQSFLEPVLNPFNLIPKGGNESPAFADLDGDGDLDMLSATNVNGTSSFIYYENIGTAKVPKYTTGVVNPFGFPNIGTLLVPTFVDLDQDGDMDLMVGTQDGNSYYFQNTGTTTHPVFSPPVLNPFGLTKTSFYLAMHTFADLDHDGKLDVLVCDFSGNMYYYKNIGLTAASPAFGLPTRLPFGLTVVPSQYQVRPVFVDLDNDGDFDILAGYINGAFFYFENIGTKELPSFAPAKKNPFGLQNTLRSYNMLALVDLDGDGDLDILTGDSGYAVDYYENKSAPSTPVLAQGSDSGISDTDNITNVIAPTFTGTAEAGSTVSLHDTDGTKLGEMIATDGTWSITSPPLSAGAHTITAKAKSTTGNYFNSVAGLNVTIQTSPGLISIVPAAATPTKTTSVNYTVTFTKDVSGVDITDFSLTNTGMVSGTISSVTNTNNRVYTVTVSNITGEGTMRLDLKASGTNIKDGMDVAIAEGFTRGIVYTFDHTPPTLSEISFIASNEDDETLAGLDYNIYLYFTSSEAITPVVTIAGQPTTPINWGGNQWFVQYTLSDTDAEGLVPFSINFQDLAGNVGTPVTTSPGTVTYDKTPPAVPKGFVAISGDTEITLKWNANTEKDLAGYNVSWGTTPDADDVDSYWGIPAGETSLTLPRPGDGITYYYKIMAYDRLYQEGSYTSAVLPKLVQTITFNEIPTKTYGSDTFSLGALVSSANLPITYLAADPSIVAITGNSAKILKVGSTEITASTAENDAYNVAKAEQKLTVNKAVLTIKATDKVRFAGTANPILTATYTGFVLNQDSTALTTLPVVTTLANLNSPIGTYDINVAAAVANNYSFDYKKGVLTVKPGAPTSITLVPVDLFENKPIGTSAGTLSSTSEDPQATFTYTLVAGTGDTDNSSFSIAGNQIKTAKVLDFETKSAYKVRVRSTTQNNLFLEKELTIALKDVNEIPTLAVIANQTICYTTAAQTVALTAISAGPETTQTTTLAISSSNADLLESLTVTGTGATGTLNYQAKVGASGTATITVTVKDNGGTANGGVDTYSRTFVITINALPIVAINSDKGTQISKGEEVYLNATGGTSYAWTANNSIQSDHNTATIKVRPLETTTYTVTATNASGCSESKTFTITVLDDVAKVKAMNIMSPNGDGVNDKWVVDNIDAYPNNEVKVFDKSGRLMYSKKGYDNSWDATLNGTPLAEGTYYYVIDFGPNKPKVKGFITVTRSN